MDSKMSEDKDFIKALSDMGKKAIVKALEKEKSDPIWIVDRNKAPVEDKRRKKPCKCKDCKCKEKKK